MKLLEGKKALVLGVANDRSIGWGVTQAFQDHGARMGLSYLNDALYKRVQPLSETIDCDLLVELDVGQDEHIARLAEAVSNKWGKFDILVHSLAFANRDDLVGRFSETSRQGFSLAMDISAYSLIALSRALRPLMNPNSSIIAMTYHGSQKVMTNYNVMGVAKAALEATSRYLADDLGPESIRVNCISAGPIKTLAASGITGFRSSLQMVEARAPLRRNITTEDVAGTAVYLASDLSRNVTGQVLYVDSGYSIMS